MFLLTWKVEVVTEKPNKRKARFLDRHTALLESLTKRLSAKDLQEINQQFVNTQSEEPEKEIPGRKIYKVDQ